MNQVAATLPVVDRAMLDEVTGGDEELTQELATLYLEDVGGQFGDLDAAVSAMDFARIAAIAHGLKGASASMGCEQVAHFFKLLEEGGRTESSDGLPEALEGAREAFGRVREALGQAA